jgi:hypothetical protein
MIRALVSCGFALAVAVVAAAGCEPEADPDSGGVGGSGGASATGGRGGSGGAGGRAGSAGSGGSGSAGSGGSGASTGGAGGSGASGGSTGGSGGGAASGGAGGTGTAGTGGSTGGTGVADAAAPDGPAPTTDGPAASGDGFYATEPGGELVDGRPWVRLCPKAWDQAKCCMFLCTCLNDLCSDSPADKARFPNCMSMCTNLQLQRARCQVYHCFESKNPRVPQDHASHCGHASGRVGGGGCSVVDNQK